MAGKYIVDHESTPEDFTRLLSWAKNKEGTQLNIEHIDRESAKPLKKLFEEAKKQEAILKFNPETERLERHARSARTRIYELRRNIVWYEIGRSFPSGKFLAIKKDFSTSETLMPQESGLEGAVRVNLEEMKETWLERIGYLPRPEQLIPGRRTSDPHESTVYDDILSIVDIHWFDLYLDLDSPSMSLGKGIIINKDSNGVAAAKDNWVKTYLAPEVAPQPPQLAA